MNTKKRLQNVCLTGDDAIAQDGLELNMQFPMELFNSLKFIGVANHLLELKVAAPVMLLRNLNQGSSLYNDTPLIATRLGL